jgi:putative ABC transport system permease protein
MRMDTVQSGIATALQPLFPSADVRVAPVTFDRLYLREIGEARFQRVVLTTFTAIALLLAGVGAFGVVSFLVAQGVRDLAIRLALGAVPRAVWRRTVLATTATAFTGFAIGAVAAWQLESVILSRTFGWQSSVVWTWVFVATTLLLMSALAAAIAARRIVRIDPVAVLRAE